jgi:hypothetical protein
VSGNHYRCAFLIALIGFLKLSLSGVLIGKFIRSSIVNATAESLANTKKISKQKLKKLAT